MYEFAVSFSLNVHIFAKNITQRNTVILLTPDRSRGGAAAKAEHRDVQRSRATGGKWFDAECGRLLSYIGNTL